PGGGSPAAAPGQDVYRGGAGRRSGSRLPRRVVLHRAEPSLRRRLHLLLERGPRDAPGPALEAGEGGGRGGEEGFRQGQGGERFEGGGGGRRRPGRAALSDLGPAARRGARAEAGDR